MVYLTDQEENNYRESISNKKLHATVKTTIPRIEILGDSQVREMGAMLAERATECKTFASATSGATTDQLCVDLNNQLSHLLPSDIVFLLSGSNDFKITKNQEVQVAPHSEAYQEFFTHRKHTNICVISTPPRHDNPAFQDYINKYNEEVEQLCRTCEVPYINLDNVWVREDFTQHGLHLNQQGKEKVIHHILNEASKTLALSFL